MPKLNLKKAALAILFVSLLLPVKAIQKCSVPISVRTKEDQAITAYEKGYKFYQRGLFHKAEDSFIEALKYEPNLIKAHYWLGKLYRESGQLENAIYHWEEVERLNSLLHERRIALSIQNNEYPARTQILKAIQLRTDAQKAFEKGIYLLDQGHWDGAEVELRKAVRLYPANHQYLKTLARLLWDKNEKSASIKFYRDLLSLRDVSYQDFLEGIDRILKADMQFVAVPLIIKNKHRFSGMTEFDKICCSFTTPPQPDIVAAGKVVERLSGQVIVNIGMQDGITLADEYSLNLRAFRPGKPIVDPDTGKIIGRGLDQPTADLLITKVNRQTSWALIKREIGPGVKAGDLIEIQKTVR